MLVVKIIFQEKIEFWKTKKGNKLIRHKAKDNLTAEFLRKNNMIQISEVEAEIIIVKNEKSKRRKYKDP